MILRWNTAWGLIAVIVCMTAFVFPACVRDDATNIVNSIGGANGGGSGGSGAAGGGGSGAIVCQTTDDCPGQDTTCRSRTCDAGDCGVADATAGTTCSEDGGSVCDGGGNCVECNANVDCGNLDVCQMNSCVPPSCTDGQLDGNETDVDCGGPDCAPCVNGSICYDDPDCDSNFCDDGSGGAGGSGGSR
jgi:hypothetical protein